MRALLFVGFLLVLLAFVIVAAVGQNRKHKELTELRGNLYVRNNNVAEDSFGYFSDPKTSTIRNVLRFTLTNQNKFTVQVITYGGHITVIKVPDSQGNFEDVVMGFSNTTGYLSGSPFPYIGATIGRVANRIANASFQLNNITYNLTKNLGPNTIHGGIRGFDKVIWEPSVEGRSLVLKYISADGEEGFPGEVTNQIKYTVTNDNQLVVVYKATTTKSTPINIINHSYFNLNGHGAGPEALYKHTISIDADQYTEVAGEYSLPTGKIFNVTGTYYDLRSTKEVGRAIKETKEDGFDTNYCINNPLTQPGVKRVARVVDPISGRYMDVGTDQPGVQFYTSNSLPDLVGKQGAKYMRHGALCLETQKYPDSVHHKNFPSTILNPGQLYTHTTSYKFGVLSSRKR